MSFGFGMGFTRNDPFAGGPSLNLQFVGNTVLDPSITFTRALNTATYFNSAGLLTTANANVPRFDYNPSTLAPRGLLIEEQRTNLLRYSEDFSNSVWNNATPNLPTVGVNTTVAPDGTTTADTLTAATGGTSSQARQFTTTGTTGNFTGSVYLKAGTSSRSRLMLVDSTTGFTVVGDFLIAWTAGVASVLSVTSGTASVVDVGNGWYRCVITANVPSANANVTLGIFPDVLAGTNSVIAWGAQLEAGAFATSYIPTVASQVTRNADVASVNTLSPWYNASEGTLFGEAAVSYTSGGSNLDAVASVDDNTTNNRIQIRRNAATQIPSGIVMAAGTATFNSGATGATTVGANTVFRIGMAYKANDSIFGDRGLLSTVDTSVTIPTVTQLQIGNGTALQQLNGWVRRITYYPRRLSNAELQSITS